MDIEQDKRLELLEAIKNAAALIEQAHDIAAITRYINLLDEFKVRLVALPPRINLARGS